MTLHGWWFRCFLSIFFGIAAQASPSLLIVIDPGHGGSDKGTTFTEKGHQFTEKDISLQVARVFAEELRRRDHRVILTRTKDQELPVIERTQVANRLKADLFISLHLNSMPKGSKSPEGVETYILNNTNDRSSKRLADLENAVLKGSAAQAGDRSSDVSLILKDLILDANLEKSRRLACAVQNGLVNAHPERERKNRGVKQALFYVLLGADMPSVLVELGFLAHSDDRFFLTSAAGQARLAKGFADAIETFRSPKPVSCKVR